MRHAACIKANQGAIAAAVRGQGATISLIKLQAAPAHVSQWDSKSPGEIRAGSIPASGTMRWFDRWVRRRLMPNLDQSMVCGLWSARD